MRYESFDKNQYYHLSSSTPHGTPLFVDDEDRVRLIFLLTHLQSPVQIYNSAWHTQRFLKKGAFSLTDSRVSGIVKHRKVSLLAFCLLPNKFDLLIHNLEERMLSVYMHRTLTAYSKYFNAKYNKRGHVFAGPFVATRLKPGELPDFSAIIHKPHIDGEQSAGYRSYPWSSYKDFIGSNRWGKLLSPDIILDKFKNKEDYIKFVSNFIRK